MIRPRITETIAALGRAVKSASLGFDGVDRILLVGGSSRIPLVAEMVRESTGRPIAVDAHPKHSMALGAAFVAEQRRLAAQADSDATAADAAAAGAGAILAVEAASGTDAAGGGDGAEADTAGGAAGAIAAGAAVAGAAAVGGAGAGDAAGGDAAAGDAAAADAGSGTGLPPGTPVESPGGGAFPPTEVVPVVGAGTAVAASADGGSNRNRTIAVAAAIGGIALVLLAGLGASGMLTGGAPSSPPASVAVVSTCAVGRPVDRADPVPHRGPDPDRRSRSPTAVPTPTPTPAGRQARITRDRDHQRSLRRRLRGVRLHARRSPAATCTSSSTPSRWRMPASPATGRGSCTPGPFRSPATRSATGRPPRTRCASSSRTPNHSIVENTGNCMDLP